MGLSEAQSYQGEWLPEFNHDITRSLAVFPNGEPDWQHWPDPNSNKPPFFNALNSALIAVGRHRGKVLLFDNAPISYTLNGQQGWIQRWSILDPYQGTFLNFSTWFPRADG